MRLERHTWRGRSVVLEHEAWDRFAAVALGCPCGAEQHQLVRQVRTIAAERLAERERLVFEAAVGQQVPLDVLAERLSSTRATVYRTLQKARAKLREALAESGWPEVRE